MNGWWRAGWAILAIAGLSLSGGCGISSRHYARFEGHLRGGDCEGARAYVAESADEYGKNARLLHLLDGGTVALLCGAWEEAARNFNEADRLADELWTISLSRHAASYLVNDMTQPYGGEDFERVMIHLLAATAYVMLDQPDEALVEARRMDEKLSALNDRYKQKNAYREDAFGRYLSGMIYESQGQVNDAFIDYRKALEAYGEYGPLYGTPLPPSLVPDLVRTGRRLGFSDEIEKLEEDYPVLAGARQADPSKGLGRVVLIQFDGRAPRKVSEQILIPTDAGPMAIAFPRFERDALRPRPVRLNLTAPATGRRYEAGSVVAEDVEAIAIRNLEDRGGRVALKAVARAAAKQVAIAGTSRALSNDKKKQKDIEALLHIANLFLERADTRSWRTLPAWIRMASLFVEPGEYRASAGPGGQGVLLDLGSLSVAAGETRFLFIQTVY